MASAAEIRSLLQENNSVIKKDITEAKSEVVAALKKDIEEAKTEVLATVNSTLQTHLLKIDLLEKKVEILEENDRQRNEKDLQREVLHKKHNLLLYKVEEDELSQEALQVNTIKLLSDITGQNIDIKDIDYMYRLGKKEANKRRPIIIRFISLLKRDSIIKNWKLFSEKNMEISEDFPEEIRNRRKLLLPVLKDLKTRGLKVSLRVDKLLVNGEIWSTKRAEEFLRPIDQESEAPVHTSNKRKERSPSPSKHNNKKKPSLKLNVIGTPGSSIKEFFQPSISPATKSPVIVLTRTPHKNEQVTTIVADS